MPKGKYTFCLFCTHCGLQIVPYRDMPSKNEGTSRLKCECGVEYNVTICSDRILQVEITDCR